MKTDHLPQGSTLRFRAGTLIYKQTDVCEGRTKGTQQTANEAESGPCCGLIRTTEPETKEF